jgi:hypothetical protein
MRTIDLKKYQQILATISTAKIEIPLYQTYFSESLRFELEDKSPDDFGKIFQFLSDLYDDLFGSNNRSEVLIVRQCWNKCVPIPFDFLISGCFMGDSTLPILTFNNNSIVNTVYLLNNTRYNNDRLFRFCFYGLIDSTILFVSKKGDRVLNIYDNRGCDVVVNNKQLMKKLYEKYSDWILDYNRAEIEIKLGVRK